MNLYVYQGEGTNLYYDHTTIDDDDNDNEHLSCAFPYLLNAHYNIECRFNLTYKEKYSCQIYYCQSQKGSPVT